MAFWKIPTRFLDEFLWWFCLIQQRILSKLIVDKIFETSGFTELLADSIFLGVILGVLGLGWFIFFDEEIFMIEIFVFLNSFEICIDVKSIRFGWRKRIFGEEPGFSLIAKIGVESFDNTIFSFFDAELSIDFINDISHFEKLEF